MKKRVLFILQCLLLGVFSVMADDEATILEVGGNLCTPITVKLDNGSTYQVYSQITVSGIHNVRSATDCRGNDIVLPRGSSSYKTGSYHYRTYRFSTLWNRTSNSSSSSSNRSSNNYGSDIAESIVSTGAKIGRSASAAAQWQNGDAYPGLHAQLGLSKAYGEFVRLRIAAGGFNLLGGVGKDWVWKGANSEKLSWHVGLGYYGAGADPVDPNQDISLSIVFAENAGWEGYSLTFDLGYCYWFGDSKRFGAFGGAGLGAACLTNLAEGNEFDAKFCWNVELGLAFRICHF